MFWLWLGFAAFVAVLLWLDLFVFHRESREIPARQALAWSVFWIALGLGFSGVVYLLYEHQVLGVSADGGGLTATVDYLTGYVLEKSLSVDNLFVMAMIFSSLDIPDRYQHRVLFWGIAGALVMRFLMIMGGLWLVNHFTWTFYVFGGLLIVSGIRMLAGADEDLERVWWMRLIKRIIPVAAIDGHRLWVRDGATLALTPLALALVLIETADIIFAVDSVPAVLAVTTDPFIVVTSNVFAILGLRSLYFVLASMIRRFRYLELALSLLLVLIGFKMLAHDAVDLSNTISLAVVLGVVGAGVGGSLLAERLGRRDPDGSGDADRPDDAGDQPSSE